MVNLPKFVHNKHIKVNKYEHVFNSGEVITKNRDTQTKHF